MRIAPERELAVNPDMLVLARDSRGETQLAASHLIGVSQAWLSKAEAGLVEPSPELLDRIATTYEYPVSFFLQTDPLTGPGTSEFVHRKRNSASARLIRQLHAEVNIRTMHVSRLLRVVDSEGQEMPEFDPESFPDGPRDVARAVRAHWLLPPGPVASVTTSVENAGGIIILRDPSSRLVDAVSRHVPGLPPIFFLNSGMPGDRMRFTLAHELGHIVMHRIPNHEVMEQQADAFAAEFLMPESDIRHQLDRVNLDHLAALKPYWKVSMAALLKRAADLGKISPRTARTLWVQMGRAGYRLHEPSELDIPLESPRLLREIIRVHTEQLGYTLEDLSRALCISEPEAQELYEIAPTREDVKRRLMTVSG